ncbi:diguanylate cyclase domain-containing protein [Pyxidicoccus xibeiensis]|uniref:diguanylate cyclase domain-containing protein n=1 Tax=Pyxidicoccus xibeiensis TaxID=2906759 RepID=UPI0020A7D209|nr:diguanylate cyclase [Pyxidicoccus xibeiensis]MCP3137688.1 diguanylate cyclase [Pyxidicoccus xibeiensis]
MALYALIAEPDPARAAGLLSLIQGEGLEGVVVRDGAEAQEVVRQRSAPTLLVTDLALPRVDGFALLTWLRERDDAAGTHVVVVTAFDELRVRAWQLKDALGIHSLLSRRASVDLMRDTMRRVIAGQRAPPPPPPESSAELEQQRLARIETLKLVDEGPPEAELQALVTEVAQAFGVPVALLSLVLGERQWFKAHVGLPPSLAQDRGTPRDWAFCHHVVQGREPLVVPDATRHPVFRDNPLVRDGIVGSYAGAPLLTSSGEVLGSLCVIDTRPLMLGAEDLSALRELAGRVAGDLEQKARVRQAAQGRRDTGRAPLEPALTEASALALLRDAVQALDVAVLLVAPGRRPFACNSALAELLGLPAERIPALSFEAFCQHVAGLTADPALALRQLDLASESSRGFHLTVALERPRPRRLRWVARPFPVPGGIAQLLTLSDLGSAAPARDERERLLRVDALTGLDTRRSGEERLLREIGRCRRDGVPFTLLLVDLVGLGTLNATRGFDAGDAALRDVARRVERFGAPSGFAVRWEGGTLLVALPGVDASGAEGLRQQLRADPGAPEVVTAAIGVEGEEDPQGTLARARAALARAKAERKPAHPG